MIRNFQPKDIKALLDIYNYYVMNSVVTFDVEPSPLEPFEAKINRINLEYPCLVFEENNEILGYAYGGKFRPRPAYDHTVESTVYLKQGAHGKQIGSKLYKELIVQFQKRNMHVILGLITLPNEASVKLHEKFGFKQVAKLEEVGMKFDAWHDVGVWQLKV